MIWKNVALGELCEVLDSKRKPITKKDRTTGSYPYYGATGIVDYVGDFIFNEKLVLIGEDGAKWDSGDMTAFIADGEYWVNNHAHVIKPLRNCLLDEWLVYYFYYKDLKEFVTGLTVPKLNQGQLKTIPIPLPPLATQKKIVTKLDAIFAEIDTATAAAEANAKNVESLFQSYLRRIFDDTSKDLNAIFFEECIEKVILNNKIQRADYLTEGFFPIVSQESSLVNGFWNVEEDVYIIDKSVILFGDHTRVLKYIDFNFVLGADGVKIIKPKSFIDSKFFYYFLLANPIEGKGYARHYKFLKELKLKVPTLDIQKETVSKLDAVSTDFFKSTNSYKNKVNELFLLKISILNKAFNDELVKD